MIDIEGERYSAFKKRFDDGDKNWETRLGLFAQVMEAAGVLGPQDSQINDVIWQEYLRSLQADPEAWGRFVQEYKAMSFGQKVQLTASLRNGLIHKVDKIRDLLKEEGLAPSGAEAIDSVEDLVERLKIDRIEHPSHPLAHLYPTSGYEVEFGQPANRLVNLYWLLDSVGFARGGGGNGSLESSPGPFRRPETAAAIFLLWTQTGLFDFYREYSQTFHSNLGVKLMDEMPELVVGQMATGYAWMPHRTGVPIDKKEDNWRLRIYLNQQENGTGPYREVKDFEVLTVHGAVRHLYFWSHLGCALMAYQKALLEWKGLDWETRLARWSATGQTPGGCENILFDSMISDQKLKPARISQLKTLTWDEKKLAYIWSEYSRDLHRGFAALGIEGVLQRKVPMETAKRFADMVDGVLPDVWSRYEEGRVKIQTHPLVVKDKRFANVVDFARTLSWQADHQVVTILKAAETDFQKYLANWRDKGVINPQMMQRFPLDNSNGGRSQYEIQLRYMVRRLGY